MVKVLSSFLLGLALLALAPFALADYVPPQAPEAYVLDEANVLSAETEAILEAQLQLLEEETSTQMVVVTVNSLQDYPVETAALEIGRSWGVIGSSGLENGLVLLFAPTERYTRIEVGRGLEGAITDLQSGIIYRQILVTNLATDNYDLAAIEAITQLEILARGEPFTLSEAPAAGEGIFYLLFILAPFLWMFLSWLSDSKAWWLGGIFGAGIAAIVSWSLLSIAAGIVAGLMLDFVLSTFFYKKLSQKYRSNFFVGGSSHRGGRGGSGGGSSFSGFIGKGGGFGGGGAGGRF